MLEAKIPDGPLEQKWSHYRSTAKLVSPGNRDKLHVVVVGTGLSGSSLAAHD
jgi:succinate dehydrogenase / fumarate reductase, flavoprotein subunit